MERQQVKPYPLRLEGELREEVEKLALIQDRSVNWQLNQLVKIGLANFESSNRKAPNSLATGSGLMSKPPLMRY